MQKECFSERPKQIEDYTNDDCPFDMARDRKKMKANKKVVIVLKKEYINKEK